MPIITVCNSLHVCMIRRLILFKEFIDARPSAELTPLSAGEQDDESESEMGLTYDELSTFGVLRKVTLFKIATLISRSNAMIGRKTWAMVMLSAALG